MILSTFGKIALNFHGYSSFCFDILKKLFFKKSIFLGTEVEDGGGFCSFLKDCMFFFLTLLVWVFCLKVYVCTMCLLIAHGSGEGLGYLRAGICTLLGAAIWELGVQQGYSGREASVLVSEPSLQHSSLYSLKYLHLDREYMLFTFSSHAKASFSYALQWFHIHTHTFLEGFIKA